MQVFRHIFSIVNFNYELWSELRIDVKKDRAEAVLYKILTDTVMYGNLCKKNFTQTLKFHVIIALH